MNSFFMRLVGEVAATKDKSPPTDREKHTAILNWKLTN